MVPNREKYFAYFLLASLVTLSALFLERYLLRYRLDDFAKQVLSLVFAAALAGLWYGLPYLVGRLLARPPEQVRQALTFPYLVLFPLVAFSDTRLASLGATILMLMPIIFYCAYHALQSANSQKSTWTAVAGMALFYVLLSMNLLPSVDRLVNSLEPALRNPTATYDDKMVSIWGDYYQFMRYLRDNTPQNATVLVPRVNISYAGRSFFGPYVQYFLYPRWVKLASVTGTCRESSESVAMIVVSADNLAWPPNFQGDHVKWFMPAKAGMIYPCGQENSQ